MWGAPYRSRDSTNEQILVGKQLTGNMRAIKSWSGYYLAQLHFLTIPQLCSSSAAYARVRIVYYYMLKVFAESGQKQEEIKSRHCYTVSCLVYSVLMSVYPVEQQPTALQPRQTHATLRVRICNSHRTSHIVTATTLTNWRNSRYATHFSHFRNLFWLNEEKRQVLKSVESFVILDQWEQLYNKSNNLLETIGNPTGPTPDPRLIFSFYKRNLAAFFQIKVIKMIE